MNNSASDNGEGTIHSRPVHPTSSNEKTIFILGDGDFSYTYDLARNLLMTVDDENGAPSNSTATTRLIASGLDTRAALLLKYKDARFLLRQIEKMGPKEKHLSVEVRHGVDALIFPPNTNEPAIRADVVIFNHPHMGREDAVGHSQFLSHFFYSCVTHWMRPGLTNTASNSRVKNNRIAPILYLTLVQGQWERWKGASAAARQGLCVQHRSPWLSPPLNSSIDGKSPHYYQLRRHQTGKSFASRRNTGSEVICLVRTTDLTSICHDTENIVLPYPFRHVSDHGNQSLISPSLPNTSLQQSPQGSCATSAEVNHSEQCACRWCDKKFAEKRSLRNHIMSKHGENKEDIAGPPRKRAHRMTESKISGIIEPRNKPAVVTSSSASTNCGAFANQQSLEDHMRAKHQALHTNVRPSSKIESNGSLGAAATTICTIAQEECAICGWTGTTSVELHYQSLLPSPPRIWTCRYCPKHLREERAWKQHENSCRARLSIATARQTAGE